MFGYLDNHTQNGGAPHDECDKCRMSICCVVFSICSPNLGFIKDQYVRCEHLREEGGCKIYENRGKYPGYHESCKSFTCHNIGPLLSEWMKFNNITFESSDNIGALLRVMQGFTGKDNRYNERYKFLQEVILRRYHNDDTLIDYFFERHTIENEFQRWISENHENFEFP